MFFAVLLTLLLGSVVPVLFCIYRAWVRFNHRPTFNDRYSAKEGRQLGLSEEVFERGHNSIGIFLMTDALVLRSKSPLNIARIREALTNIAKKRPLLRMCIKQKENGTLWFEEIPDFKVNVEESDVTDWKTLQEDELHNTFDSKIGPLWRVKYLPNAKYSTDEFNADEGERHPHECVCLFAIHHAIVDGSSVTRIYADFIDQLHALSTGKESRLDVKVENDIMPPLEHYLEEAGIRRNIGAVLKEFVTTSTTLGALIKLFVKEPRNAYTEKFGTEKGDRHHEIERKTRMLTIEFTPDETSAILAGCKAYGATVQGAAQTAAAVAMARLMCEAETETDWEATDVSMFITADVQRHFTTPMDDDAIGCYISAVEMIQRAQPYNEPKEFWCQASAATKELHSRLADHRYLENWLFLNTSASFIETYPNRLIDGRYHSEGRSHVQLVFTNLRNCSKQLDRSDEAEVTIRARFGHTAEQILGPIFANSFITFNNRLFWTVMYYQNVMTTRTAEKFADAIKDTFINAC